MAQYVRHVDIVTVMVGLRHGYVEESERVSERQPGKRGRRLL